MLSSITTHQILDLLKRLGACDDGLCAAETAEEEAIRRIVDASDWSCTVVAAEAAGLSPWLGWAVGRVIPVDRLKRVDLSGADLRWADLSGVHLCDAVLCDADLSDADLSGADLSGVHLRGAKLRGAKLRGAKLSGANAGEQQA